MHIFKKLTRKYYLQQHQNNKIFEYGSKILNPRKVQYSFERIKDANK